MPLINRTFSDIITFTRASAATMFDSTGTLVYAPMNAIRNNTMVGAVAGTPGTLPTNWQITGSGLGTLTREVVGTGVVNGITYIDLRISGTTSTTGLNYAFEPTIGGPASSSGQTWTSSVYVALVGGSLSNINQISGAAAVGRTSGGAGTTDNFTSGDNKAALTSTLQRFSATGTLVDAATTSLQPYARVTFSSGVAIDITLRIGLPQLELGSVARTAIATSGTAYQGPRFDYDPVTLAARGMLIEEQRTNLLLQSEDFATTWVTGAPYSVSTNTETAPDGLQTADSLIVASGQSSFNTAVTRQVVSKAASSIQYTRSAFCKALGSTTSVRFVDFGATTLDHASVVVSLIDGSVITAASTVGSFSNASVVVSNAGNGWWRVSLTYTTDAHTSVTVRSFPYVGTSSLIGDGSSGLYIYGAQLEAGAFPTSYIPTTTAAATRAADVASVNTLAPWFNASEGTLFGEFSSYASGARAIVGISDGTLNNRIQFFANSGDPYTIASRLVSGGTQTNPANTGSIAIGSIGKAAIAYAVGANQGATSVNGGVPTTSSPAAIAVGVNTLELGKGSALANMSGHIRRIGYYKRRLSNAQLQAITQ